MEEDLSESIDQKEYTSKRRFARSVKTLYYDLHDRRDRIYQDTPRVIKGEELPFRGGPRMWNKNLVHPGMDELWTQSLHVHVKEMVPKAESQRHYHQNEAVMYILNGKGYEIFDNERYEWEAGDIVTIPGGCVHQHFAAEDSDPPRVLISKPKPLCMFLNLHFQQQIELPPDEPVQGWENHDPNANRPEQSIPQSPRADGHGLPLPEDWDEDEIMTDGHSVSHDHDHHH
jgi:mannose-6-phosphate isomerase-like protein (cupin superfamily)